MTWALKKRSLFFHFSIGVNELGFLAPTMCVDFIRASQSKLFTDKSFVFHACLGDEKAFVVCLDIAARFRSRTYDLMVINPGFAAKIHPLFVLMLDQTTDEIVFIALADILEE